MHYTDYQSRDESGAAGLEERRALPDDRYAEADARHEPAPRRGNGSLSELSTLDFCLGVPQDDVAPF